MKFAEIIQIVIIFINLNNICAKSRFAKIEECSASNISAKINICEIVNGKFSIKYEIITPLEQGQVFFLHF